MFGDWDLRVEQVCETTLILLFVTVNKLGRADLFSLH